MKYLFKGVISLYAIIVAIPLSLILAVIIWFFATVLFGADDVFLGTTKGIYIILLAVSVLFDTLRVLLRIYLSFALAKKFEASFSDALEALMEHEVSEKEGFRDWTPKKFQDWLSTQRTSKAFAKAVVGAMFG